MFELNGPEFLVLYLGLGVVALLVYRIFLAVLRRRHRGIVPVDQVSAAEVGLLVAGTSRSAAAALLEYQDLAEQRQPHAAPLARAVASVVGGEAALASSRARALAADAGADHGVEARLEALGLILDPRSERARRKLGVAVCGGLFALGSARLVSGLVHHRPVGYLIAALLVVGVVLIRVAPRSVVVTAAGRELLRSLRQRYKLQPSGVAPAMAFALIGWAALSEQLRAKLQMAGYSQSAVGAASSGGCSCGGGGGCGGGCGGCGGCGG